MIPLFGRCELTGAWPESSTRLLLQLERAAGDAESDRLDASGITADITANLSVNGSELPSGSLAPVMRLGKEFATLAVGDIVALDRRSSTIRVLFRSHSSHNSFLVTERCDNYCVMCSQPPRDVDDGWIVDELATLIPRIPTSTREIGFTGGEPTLLGDRFISLISLCKEHLPDTTIHVLSNGRRFADPAFARAWSDVQHPDLMVGIPVYGDVSTVHDFVVQADGAFDETIRGILNLKRRRQAVEIRYVLHRHTIPRLAAFARFIAGNLRFVDHVALMGLELMGFGRANADTLWIDPPSYQYELADAVRILDNAGIRTSVYNLPLCVLAPDARRFAVRSISDWKREYAEPCTLCTKREECSGVFFSSRARLEPLLCPM